MDKKGNKMTDTKLKPEVDQLETYKGRWMNLLFDKVGQSYRGQYKYDSEQEARESSFDGDEDLIKTPERVLIVTLDGNINGVDTPTQSRCHAVINRPERVNSAF